MQRIRLLTCIQGGGAVAGDVDDVIEVDDAVALVWADGVRAELLPPPISLVKPVPLVKPVELVKPVSTPPAAPVAAAARTRQRKRSA